MLQTEGYFIQIRKDAHCSRRKIIGLLSVKRTEISQIGKYFFFCRSVFPELFRNMSGHDRLSDIFRTHGSCHRRPAEPDCLHISVPQSQRLENR